VFFKEALEAEYGVEELGDDAVEVAGGQAVGVIDQLL